MERHLSIHPSSDTESEASSDPSTKDTTADSVGRHADASDGAGHHWASMDHTMNVVTPNYNQSSHYDTDVTHGVMAVSDFGFSATSGFGVADASSCGV